MNQSNIWYLENIDAQGIFCPDKLKSDTGRHVHVRYKKGERIYSPDDSADKLYFIASGRVKICTEGSEEKTMTKAILSEGEIFGEKALTGSNVRRDMAVALEPTELCIMLRDEMTSLFRDHNPFYLFMMKIIGNRALNMEKRLEALIFKDSRSRVIDFLVELNDHRGQRVGYEWVVRKFMTHQEIANLTATSRQTVTTVLNELKAKYLITFDRKRLLIRDLDKLRSEGSPMTA